MLEDLELKNKVNIKKIGIDMKKINLLAILFAIIAMVALLLELLLRYTVLKRIP